MFQKEHKSKITATVLPLAAAIGLLVGTSAVKADEMMGGHYATSGQADTAVMNAYKECWESKYADPKMREECGDKMPEPEPEEPAPMVDGDLDGDGVPDSRDKCPNTRSGATVDSDGCEIVENLTINLVEGEFDFDSAELKPGMEAALTELAGKIKDSAGHEMVTVVGHTDSTGAEDYNMGLSERRADAAADFLEGLGIEDVGRKGMGESEPVDDNGTREGRAANRRVEITTQ